MKRVIGKKRFNKTIFIFTQGSVTEVEYFNYFKNKNRVKSLQIQVKTKHETNALNFVKYAVKNYKQEIKEFDEFWLVFDKDATDITDFNNALKIAKKIVAIVLIQYKPLRFGLYTISNNILLHWIEIVIARN